MSTQIRIKEEIPDPEYDKIETPDIKIKAEPVDVPIDVKPDPSLKVKTEPDNKISVNIFNNISNDSLAEIVNSVAIDIDPELINEGLEWKDEESKSPIPKETDDNTKNQNETKKDLLQKDVASSSNQASSCYKRNNSRNRRNRKKSKCNDLKDERTASPYSSQFSESIPNNKNHKTFDIKKRDSDIDILMKRQEEIRKALREESQSNSNSNEEYPQSCSTVLNVMPLPVKVKVEPRDDYPDPTIQPLKRIKLEKPTVNMSTGEGREEALNHCRDLIKMFSKFDTKFPKRFLYTATAVVKPIKTKRPIENRSPLVQMNNIQFQFSSTVSNINIQQYGIHKLSEKTSKIIRLLGFNVQKLLDRSQDKQKAKGSNKATTDANKTQTFFTSAATQTEELKCNKCIIRKLRKVSDIGVQATDSTGNLTSAISNLSLKEIGAVTEFIQILKCPLPYNTTDLYHTKEKLFSLVKTCQPDQSLFRSPLPLPSYLQPEYAQKFNPSTGGYNEEREIPEMTMDRYLEDMSRISYIQSESLMNYPMPQRNKIFFPNSEMDLNPANRMMRPDEPQHNRQPMNMNIPDPMQEPHFSGYKKHY